MMRFDPSVLISRVVILRGTTAVYDELFHEGVNVIRGENSSGKSTVMNFIYYSLGGDLTEWSEIALLCSRVSVEVRLSGIVATLSREVAARPGMPMEMFGGTYEESLRAPRDAWTRYPYQRTTSQESFSQAIFRLLGMPEVISDMSGNVTIHQILRLLYADQLSNVEDIFRFQRFEQNALRDTIGRLLCGAYDSKLYNNEQEIGSLEDQFKSTQAELRSLFVALGKTDQVPTVEWIESTRELLGKDLLNTNAQIDEAERELFTSASADKFTLDSQNKAYDVVQRLQADISAARSERDALAFNIADSNAFIASLEAKIEALRDSASVADHFGNVRFHACPACYAVIEGAAGEDEHACHLCKTPFDPELIKNRVSGLINENAVQVKQSKMLQARRYERSEELGRRMTALEGQWNAASARLQELQRLPSSEARQKLRELQRQVGYLQRQIEDTDRLMEIVKIIAELSRRKEDLNAAITRLKSENEGMVESQRNRLSHAYTSISDEIKLLLHRDLRRQDSFENAQSVNFTFSQNKITVDGHSYFSASSRAILKSSFCLGFMAAAAKAPYFRHPRFCMIDVLENMGVELVRSHNFQMQIARVSTELRAQHQIIYATAMIAPELDDEIFTIGRHSTRDAPTLALG